MDATQLLVTVLVAWAAIGLATSFVMGRRGHDLFSWWVLGAVFGPLIIPLALDHVRRERRARPRHLAPGRPGAGTTDVLVGIDGSPESEAALRAVLDLFGGRLGRLTLATVLDYDAALADRRWEVEQRAVAELERLTATVPSPTPETVLLAGRPAAALARYATEQGYELLAVGARGKGATGLLGSVATQLAHGAGPPVLIVGESETR